MYNRLARRGGPSGPFGRSGTPRFAGSGRPSGGASAPEPRPLAQDGPDPVQVGAITESDTARGRPSTPRARTRSRPRCPRLVVRDSTPGCFLRIAANSLSDPHSRSTFPGHPFFGSALTTGSPSKSARFAGLWKPRWRLTARRFGNRAGAARTTGTAWSVSPPSHMTAWVGTSPRVLHDADRNPGLDRTSGLAFRDPPRVRLEYREGPLAVRDRLAPEQAAVNLVDLPHRMRHAGSDGIHRRYIDAACLQFRKGSLRAKHHPAAQGQAPLHIVRLGAASHPDRREPLPHPLRQVPPLAPLADVVLRRRAGRLADHAAHRVPERDGIRGMADIGLHQEGVTAPGQGRARLFSRDRMAALHDQAVDLRQQLRVRELHIVHYIPVFVVLPVPNIRVFGELPDRVVVVPGSCKRSKSQPRPCFMTPITGMRHISMPGRPTRLSVPGRMCLSKSANRRDRNVLSLYRCWSPSSNAGMSSLDLMSIPVSPMSTSSSFIRRLRTYPGSPREESRKMTCFWRKRPETGVPVRIFGPGISLFVEWSQAVSVFSGGHEVYPEKP